MAVKAKTTDDLQVARQEETKRLAKHKEDTATADMTTTSPLKKQLKKAVRKIILALKLTKKPEQPATGDGTGTAHPTTVPVIPPTGTEPETETETQVLRNTILHIDLSPHNQGIIQLPSSAVMDILTDRGTTQIPEMLKIAILETLRDELSRTRTSSSTTSTLTTRPLLPVITAEKLIQIRSPIEKQLKAAHKSLADHGTGTPHPLPTTVPVIPPTETETESESDDGEDEDGKTSDDDADEDSLTIGHHEPAAPVAQPQTADLSLLFAAESFSGNCVEKDSNRSTWHVGDICHYPSGTWFKVEERTPAGKGKRKKAKKPSEDSPFKLTQLTKSVEIEAAQKVYTNWKTRQTTQTSVAAPKPSEWSWYNPFSW